MGPTREYRREPFAVNSDAAVPHCKDPAVQRHQSPTIHSVFDLAPPQANSDQLPPGDYSVLFLGQPPNHSSGLTSRRNALSVR